MGLRYFIARRVIYSFVLLVLVIGLNFAIFKAMPGDPVAFLMNPFSKENEAVRKAQEEAIKQTWGLDQPIHVQLAMYVRNLLSWEFGVTFIGREPIRLAMMRKVPYTLLLIGGSEVISIILGVFLGILVIQKRGSLLDSGGVVSSLFIGALPTFWIGLVFLLVFYTSLGWFPNAGAFPRDWAGRWPTVVGNSVATSPGALQLVLSVNIPGVVELLTGYIRHLVLPMTTLIVFFVGGWMLLTRATMLETITEDYVLTARAKGLTERTVLIKHALKNASLPIITSAALSFGFVLSGAIITETVFTYPGLGGWIWSAIQFLDLQVLMAVFYVISICVIVANIVADVLYGIIDPRIKYG